MKHISKNFAFFNSCMSFSRKMCKYQGYLGLLVTSSFWTLEDGEFC